MQARVQTRIICESGARAEVGRAGGERSGREERKRRPREEGVNPFWAQRVQLSQNKRSMARPREHRVRES